MVLCCAALLVMGYVVASAESADTVAPVRQGGRHADRRKEDRQAEIREDVLMDEPMAKGDAEKNKPKVKKSPEEVLAGKIK